MKNSYRKNSGIVIFNKNKKVLLCIRADFLDSCEWQFPQGGIDKNETPQEAAIRELKEETGISSVEHVKTLDFPIRYTFPKNVVESLAKKGYHNAGQEQYWSLFFFAGDDSEIDFESCDNQEFRGCEWVDIREAPKRVIGFKRKAYESMVDEFEDIIKDY